MKKIKYLLLSVCLTILAPIASAQDAKIGYVNLPRLMSAAPQAESARNRMQREFGAREEELKAQEDELRGLQEKLLKDGPVMNADERSKLERSLRSKSRDYKTDREAFEEDARTLDRELFSSLRITIKESIDDLVKDEGYDLILSEGVLFSSDAIDITDKLLGRLDSK